MQQPFTIAISNSSNSNNSREHQHLRKLIQIVVIAMRVVLYHQSLPTIHHNSLCIIHNARLCHHLLLLARLCHLLSHHTHIDPAHLLHPCQQQQHPTTLRGMTMARVELLLNSIMLSTMSTRSRIDSATIPRRISSFWRFFKHIKRNKSPFKKSMPKCKHCSMGPLICWLNLSNSYLIRHSKHPLSNPPRPLPKRQARNNELYLFHPNKRKPNYSTTAQEVL